MCAPASSAHALFHPNNELCVLFISPGIPAKPPVIVEETRKACAKLKVLGMTCASCVNKIEKYMAGKTGTQIAVPLHEICKL